MVARQHPLEKSARAIESALATLIRDHEGSKVDVSGNKWGHLDVVVGSDMFREIDPETRDDMVWNYLQKKLDPADFANLAQVWVLDVDEYDNLLKFGDSLEGFFKDRRSDGD